MRMNRLVAHACACIACGLTAYVSSVAYSRSSIAGVRVQHAIIRSSPLSYDTSASELVFAEHLPGATVIAQFTHSVIDHTLSLRWPYRTTVLTTHCLDIEFRADALQSSPMLNPDDARKQFVMTYCEINRQRRSDAYTRFNDKTNRYVEVHSDINRYTQSTLAIILLVVIMYAMIYECSLWIITKCTER